MKKLIKGIWILVAAAGCACGDFDDSELRGRIDSYKERIETLQQKASQLQSQLDDLSLLTNGNVITSVTQDADGKFVVTYKDDSDQEYSVVLATMEEMIDVPVLGAALDEQEGVYYWTQTVDGETSWLLKGESRERIPVRGNTPSLSVDEQEYWTVNGERLVDAEGNPVEAEDGSSSIFRDASYENGLFTLTLGNGEVLSLQVFDTLNLRLGCAATVGIVDPASGYRISCELTGQAKEKALIAVAKEAGGANATFNSEEQCIDVTFDASFTTESDAHIIVMAYDLDRHVVIKPVFFTRSDASQITISTKEELLQFAADVNAGAIPAGMEILLAQDIDMTGVSDWTPIGNASFDGTEVAGNCFEGIFDGQGHSITNLVIDKEAAEAAEAIGLFGVVNHASIRNLTLGAGSSIRARNTGFLSVGGIAAVAVGASTLENCENQASISVETTVDAKRIEAGGIMGGTFATTDDIVIKKCVNSGKISSSNTADKNNGANGIQLAGILGFANGSADDSGSTRIEACENRGAIEAQAARAGGIAGGLNYRGILQESTNYAPVTNTDVTASNSRTGGIAGYMTNNSSLEKCVNLGDISFAVAGNTTQGYVAGIVSQMQTASTSVIGCANYGTIRSDIIKATNHYIAIICSNTNKTSCLLQDNLVGGKIGPYSEDENFRITEITADNYTDYLFFHLAGTDPTLEGNRFADPTTAPSK